MNLVIQKKLIALFVCGCMLVISCGQRTVNPPPVPWDSVPLIQEQKGYSLPPSLVSVDLNKDYPTLNLKIEMKERKFIPLETTPKIHLDRDRAIMYLSEKSCVIINRKRGDVFIFNLEGKCVGSFNRKEPGPYGYQYEIIDIVVDEDAEEIFILSGDILVYTYEGKFLRKLFKPKNSWLHYIINFNDTTLLASGLPRLNNFENSLLKTKPYILLSKQTGDVIGSLDVRLPDQKAVLGDGSHFISTPMMQKNGKDIYLSHIRSDTIYHIQKDGKLKPFLVRTPPVFGKGVQMIFQLNSKLGSYMFFDKVINEIAQGSNEKQMYKNESYVLDLETGEIYKTGILKFSDNFEDTINYSIDLSPFSEVTANSITTFVDADILMDEFKNGNVKSDELKKVVSALHEEDNPVLVIIKF